MSSNEVAKSIGTNPKFHQLVRLRSRLSWRMFFIVISMYYLLMITVAFNPTALSSVISDGSVVTIGWPLGAAVIVLSWLLTGVYIYRANNTIEPLNDALLLEVLK